MQVRVTGAKVLWIEVMNEDPVFLQQQVLSVATTSPDFKGFCDTDAVSK